MPVIKFVGVDPGAKGAVCVLTIVDAPDASDHGQVGGVGLYNLPLRTVGESKYVDPCMFYNILNTAAHVERVVIERPRVGGGKFSAKTVVTQAANFGVLLGAANLAMSCLVEEADPNGGRWYAEIGAACPRGVDRKNHSISTARRLLESWGQSASMLTRSDEADALLLAYLGVQRWLGRSVVPKGIGGQAARRRRIKTILDREIELAMAGVDKEKLLPLSVPCSKCGACSGSACHGSRACRERTWRAAADTRLSVPSSGQAAGPSHSVTRPWCFRMFRSAWWLTSIGGSRWNKVSRSLLDEAILAGAVYLMTEGRSPVWAVSESCPQDLFDRLRLSDASQ